MSSYRLVALVFYASGSLAQLLPRAPCVQDACRDAVDTFVTPDLSPFCTQYAPGHTVPPSQVQNACSIYSTKIPSVCSCITNAPVTTTSSSGTTSTPWNVVTVTSVVTVYASPTPISCCIAQPTLLNGDFDDCAGIDPPWGPCPLRSWTYTDVNKISVDLCGEHTNCHTGNWVVCMSRGPGVLSQPIYVCSCGTYQATAWFTNPGEFLNLSGTLTIVSGVQFGLAGSYSKVMAIPFSPMAYPNPTYYQLSARLTVVPGKEGWAEFEIIGVFHNSSYTGFCVDTISLQRPDDSCGC